MRLKDKIAIVTGAGSGFGAGIAQRFAQEGARVVVNDLREDTAGRTVETIERAGGRACACAGDVSNDADVARLVARALDAFGSPTRAQPSSTTAREVAMRCTKRRSKR